MQVSASLFEVAGQVMQTFSEKENLMPLCLRSFLRRRSLLHSKPHPFPRLCPCFLPASTNSLIESN